LSPSPGHPAAQDGSRERIEIQQVSEVQVEDGPTRAQRELSEAREQLIATAEILRVISRSRTDVQPVFDTIVRSAARLREADFSVVARFDDGLSSQEMEELHSLFPRPPQRNFTMGRAFLDGRSVHVDDVLIDPDYDPPTLGVLQRLMRYRTFLAVPILREGVRIVGCARREVKPFAPNQFELVKTFADQAVIAIENVRLFDELQARTRELELHARELQKASLAELAHLARVTSLGELTASIAHEVNQPLGAIVTNADSCLRWLDQGDQKLDEVRRTVEWIIQDGHPAGEVIRRIRALSKKTDLQMAPLDINDVVNEVIALVQREVFSHTVSLQTELAPTLPAVFADRVQLQQVLINLVINGLQAMQAVTDRPRQLVIRTREDEADQVKVTVMDCGVGISAENLDKLFNPFFTTKSGGMGMGCRSVVL
jgi:C4-dicarboxylate-specific signal transduction histidine kinase